MSDPSLWCAAFTTNCKLMSEWAVYWQAIGTVITAVVGIVGLYKIYHELKRLNEQREKDLTDREISLKLKRTEFFLNQHRRLFDNSELYEILCLIDNDNEKLANPDMSDKKRKFLTFLEEIALLVTSEQVNESVAYYMFGYYVQCVVQGKNFQKGIDFTPEHWGLLFDFEANAKIYSEKNFNGPSQKMSL